MKKILFYATICICCIFAGCQSSEEIVVDAVANANKLCPIKVSNDETIEKIDFVNNEICFSVTIDESAYSLNNLTYAQIKQYESNPKMISKVMEKYLRWPDIEDAFKDISLSVAENRDLRFKAVCKGKDSGEVFVFKTTWREVIQIPYLKILK